MVMMVTSYYRYIAVWVYHIRAVGIAAPLGHDEGRRRRQDNTVPHLPTYADVTAAHQRLTGAIARTGTTLSHTLGRLCGATIVLKFENLQFTASFKERGALNRLLALEPQQRRRGVIAMSAGNHAQGVAYHAQRLGIPATIVMPKATPFVKVEHTEAFGARVVLHGESLNDAAAEARRIEAAETLTFLHPYDDPLVIAGQGTVAVEMLEDTPVPLDCLVVPIGGGGLISGMALAAKALHPGLEIIGVQAALAPGMKAVLAGQEPPNAGATIAEGIAVKTPGLLTRQIVHTLVDDIVLVEESALESAIIHLLTIEKTLVEGAGAAPLAAVLSYPQRFAGKRVGLVLSGGNIDQRLLASVILRDLVRGGRLARLRVELSDSVGSLAGLTALIAAHGGNVVDVAHQRVFTHLPAKKTGLEVAVETVDAKRLRSLVCALREGGYPVTVLDGPLEQTDFPCTP